MYCRECCIAIFQPTHSSLIICVHIITSLKAISIPGHPQGNTAKIRVYFEKQKPGHYPFPEWDAQGDVPTLALQAHSARVGTSPCGCPGPLIKRYCPLRVSWPLH